MPTIEKIKTLREETGVSLADCKKALEATAGDIEKAKELLRKWGKELAGKKSGREVKDGIIEVYLHPNKKVGVILDIRSESDFVAKSSDFQFLAHEICLQIAAMKPRFVSSEDIPQDQLQKEKEIYEEQFKHSDKPKNVLDNIIKGKLEKYKEEISLLSQPWVKDSAKSINSLLEEYIAKFGENIIVKKFERFEI